jgi:hypothetical protein
MAGIVVMALASLWAPQQPELINSGGACQFAPCGSLEDPVRWQAAWWLWTAGFAAFLISVPIVAQPKGRLRLAHFVVRLIVAPVWVIGAGAAAAIVGLLTSVHGAATVAVSCIVGPALTLVARVVKGASVNYQKDRRQ